MPLQRIIFASITTLSLVFLAGCNFSPETTPEQAVNSHVPENNLDDLSKPQTNLALTDDGQSGVEAAKQNEITLTKEMFDQLDLFLDSYEDVIALLGEPGQFVSEETFLVHAWTQNNSGVEIGFDEGRVWRIAKVMEPTPDIAAIEVGMTYNEVVSLLGQPVDTQEMIYTSYIWEDTTSPAKIKTVFINSGYSFSETILQTKSYQDAEGSVNQGTTPPSWDPGF